ncbi:MAG: hypothetical protein ACRDG7_08595, partial [Candidatus Limnocylindria bacterium]
MELIPNQDRFDEVLRAGRGLVYNDFSGRGASGQQYNVLHAARCTWLARSNLSVRKYLFEELREAIDWLTRERGAEGQAWKKCGTCRADSAAEPTSRTVAPARATEPAHSIEQSRTSFQVRSTDSGVVEAWSTVRLPYEPAGAMVELREELRTAVGSLSAGAEEGLHAVYTSPVDQAVDAENVLFYNLGARAFAGTDHAEVSFERVLGSVPDPAAALDGRATHHHRYEVRPFGSSWRHWSAGQTLATFGPTRLDPVGALTPPSRVWHRIRSGILKVERRPSVPPSMFGLQVRLAVDEGSSIHLVAIVKPLLDGIVAAFHSHDDSAGLVLVAARVADQTGLRVEAAADLLTD